MTCLARGESGRVPEGATFVRADRSEADAYRTLDAETTWDLVVDVARQPRHVRGALDALADRAVNWAFVSSGSVYARHDEPGADESAELLPPLEGDEWTPEQYGEGKVACERAVGRARGDAALIARCGLIVGSGDLSERFGYWPARFAEAAADAGPVLVPERSDRPVQWIDVSDLAAWLLSAGLSGVTGAHDVVGETVPLQTVLDEAATVAGFRGEVVRAGDDALAAAGVAEFMGPRSLPLWLADRDWRAFMDRRGSSAVAAGLRVRPLRATVADALAWERQLGLGRNRMKAGLNRAEERDVIETVRSR